MLAVFKVFVAIVMASAKDFHLPLFTVYFLHRTSTVIAADEGGRAFMRNQMSVSPAKKWVWRS